MVALVMCGCAAAGLGVGLAGIFPAESLADSPLSWSAPALIDPGARLAGVSCPSALLCVAVDRAGNVVTSTSPTGGASAWIIAPVDPKGSGCPGGQCHGLTGVSCVSVALCVAVDDQGNVITSSNPTGGASAWQAVNVDSGNAGCGYTGDCYGLTGVSCASVSLCVAVDAVGNVISSTNPAGGASAWRRANVDSSSTFCSPGSGCFGLNRVSCPSASLCVAVDARLNVVVSINPTGGSSAWKASAVQRGGFSPQGLSGVSCASSLLCVAVDQGGDVFTSTDPTGGAGTWTLANIDGNGFSRYVTDVSCAFGTSLCVGSDDAGNVVASSNPIGGAGAWSLGSVDPGAVLAGVSCASGAFCLAVDDRGRDVVGQGSPPLAPVNISRPTIVGRAVVGQTLNEAHGGWTNGPAMFVYRWEDCDSSGNNCTAIAAANGQRYKVAASDIGHAIRVQETALNAGGTGTTATSTQVPVTPSTAVIATSLRSQLVPHGRLARITAVLKHGGIKVAFKALTAGQLVIRWYYVPKGAHLTSGKRKPVLVATGKAHFPNASTKKLQIKLSANGVQLLSQAMRVKVTARGSFRATGTRAVQARTIFTLKR